MAENLEEIRQILLNEREAKVVDLSQRLNLSEVSVRKHLSELERQGVVVRRYGGAILIENPQDVKSTCAKQSIRPDEKRAIARAAVDLIQDGENILLDTGSTMLALAGLLHNRSVRVVTNSIAIADELTQAPDVTVEVVGGSLRKVSGALIGPRAVAALGEIRVDRAFIACSGFDESL
ncbi:MAG: DeoR/GlpR family DNA-binding transcription regulator, partial [Planctomycetota bacterium]